MLIPRRRPAVVWMGSDESLTSVGEKLSPEGGFIATGLQTGYAFAFDGVGGSYSFPGYSTYGFVGRAFFTMVRAGSIEFFPENVPPLVSAVSPTDGAQDIPLSTNELKFRIEDPNGDRMSYSVTTNPDIGEGEGIAKPDGTYSIPISGLEELTEYTWTVEVSDGENEVEEQFSFFTEMLPFDPFNEGWQYRKEITINMVDGDLTGFPVLISTIDSDLRDKAQNDGDDILFMDGTGVANKLFHEIESYDGSTGELINWVNVNDLYSYQDTNLYMYYGNPGSESQQFPENVWDSNFVGVWHMHGNSYSEITDSTGNGNDVTFEEGNPIYQQIGDFGYAVDFDGDDYIKCSTDVRDTFPLTAEVYCKIDTLGVGYAKWIWTNGGDDTAGGGGGFGFGYDRIANQLEFSMNDAESNRKTYTSTGGIATPSQWYYLAYKWAGNTASSTYIVDSTSNTKGSQDAYISGSDNGLRFACDMHGNSNRLDGMIEEARISKELRSNTWLVTTYNTMSDSSSFFSVGPEESGP